MMNPSATTGALNPEEEPSSNHGEDDLVDLSFPSTSYPGQFELTGRVVRLHFRCHAPLPIGSFLRVTGSSLWAPGTSSLDPADAAPAVGRTEQSAFPVYEDNVVDPTHANMGSLYTSSVEMVTTPDDYPVWRTRKPVVVVIHNAKKSVQHHYYRYLVVSPGEQNRPIATQEDEHDRDHDDDDDDSGMVVSTSSEEVGSTAVMQWEDPFHSIRTGSTNRLSSVSLATSVTAIHSGSSDYRNLPYRTLDIDVKTATPLYEETDEAIRLDHWNARDDVSFQPYLIREAIHEENRRKLQPRTTSDLFMMEDEMIEVSDNNMLVDDDQQVESGKVLSDEGAARSILGSSGTETPPAFGANNRIFFICFHLPVVVSKHPATGEWRASWSESILAKTEGSTILSVYDAFWVGTVTTHPPIQNEADKEAVRALLQDMKCIPIFLDPATRQSHYYGFCKQVLWPAFHNIDLLDLSTSGWLSDPENVASDWDQSRLDDWWNAYNQVNRAFFTLMSGMIKPGDILWIHDYHLSLLPQQLADWESSKFGRRITRKVFFLHIPFPTSQIFRELECGEMILKGMLHADVVGFHAFDHARHFLNAAKRILGLNYESLVGGLIGMSFQGSTVLVTMSNVSIEPRMVDLALALPSVKEGRDALKRKHVGRTIIGGVDIGQRLSGTSLKLLAYECLLQDYPTWQSHVVMVLRVLMPGSRQADEAVTTREVRALVKRIQDKFGHAVIDYEELSGASLPMDKRLGLWKASDVLMTTPIREGLNHWPMEYIYAHREPEVPGVVIASEFAAISSILNGALRVNPYDIQMTATTIDKALSMDLQEREGRRYRDIDFVSSSPSDKWVKNVLRDLRDATLRNRASSESASQASTPYATPIPTRAQPVDTTAGFLAREEATNFCRLNLRSLKRAYDATQRRVIILDFNGTIVMKEPPGKYLKREILGTSGNKPPPEVLDALYTLCQDPRNAVYVVSGDSSENVLSALGQLPGLGLAVSNGARFSPPLATGETHRRWHTFDLGVDWDAVKRVALPVLSKYTARSNGSFVKLTAFSIGWSYYSCDPEWGSLQAAHLVLELESELRAFDVRFVTLKGIVEVVPRKLNKGLIVKRVLHDLVAQNPEQSVDFILCFGDDISDEKMFTSVFSFLAEMDSEASIEPGPPVMNDDGALSQPMEITSSNFRLPDPLYCYTVAVGKKPSHASVYVTDAQKVANSLVMLARGKVPDGGVQIWARENTSQLFV